MRFHNKIILVTGSSRGIGKAIAKAFARCGGHVILNSNRNELELIETYHSLKKMGYQVSYFKADLSKYQCCVDLFDFILQKTGNYPEIIINNAGISHIGLLTDTLPEMWDKIINTNLNSAYYCSYLALPHMIRNQSGSIINISSIWGSVGASCEVAYSTSKSAIHGLTRALAKEVGPSNIRVNAIACGWIDTDINNVFNDDERTTFISSVPLMRAGTVTDVANTCLHLASNKASYITGQIITLDGGLT